MVYLTRMAANSEEVNVLYLGMRADIFGALLFVPNLTKLFVIDYGEGLPLIGTKRIIRSVLQEGVIYPQIIDDYETDQEFEGENYLLHKNLVNREFIGECILPKPWSSKRSNTFHIDGGAECYTLEGPTVIVSEEDDKKNQVWRVKFIYLGKERELVYYYYRNFLQPWPEEIKNISHVISVGTYGYNNIISKERYNNWVYKESPMPDVLHEMLETRTTPNAIYYEHAINTEKNYNAYMPHPQGHLANIGKKRFNFTSENWKRKWWDGEGGRRTRRSKRRNSKKTRRN